MNQAGTPTAVVLDRHPLWHEAVEHVLQRLDVRVAVKTTSPAVALHAIEKQRHDLLVTGVTMDENGLDGIECLREARDLVPELGVVVLSGREEPDLVDAALAAGACAFVAKTSHPDKLAEAARRALEHTPYVINATDPASTLTRREREILQLLAQGLSNAQLARLLWVTEETIKFHLSNIYRKLNVSNRTEAAHWAQVRGLLETSPEPLGANA